MVSIWLKVETNLQTHINWNETLGLFFGLRYMKLISSLKNAHQEKG
jgi:hypothetical protein